MDTFASPLLGVSRNTLIFSNLVLSVFVGESYDFLIANLSSHALFILHLALNYLPSVFSKRAYLFLIEHTPVVQAS